MSSVNRVVCVPEALVRYREREGSVCKQRSAAMPHLKDPSRVQKSVLLAVTSVMAAECTVIRRISLMVADNSGALTENESDIRIKST